MIKNNIFERIEEDLRLQSLESKRATPSELDAKWKFLTSSEPNKFINSDLTIKKHALSNFRKFSLFVHDEPSRNPSLLDLRNLLSGGRRGERKILKESLDLLEKLNCNTLLKKYPSSLIGNPNLFKYKGYRYTYRWIRHIIFLSLFKNYLENKLPDNFITLDIGSSYGVFSYLLKKENPGSHNVLLDFPEQIVLAHYFLGMSFPESKIASFKELAGVDRIDRDFLNKFDFILVPWFHYKKIAPDSIDLITNFASLGEMRREWFDFYMKSEPFLSTQYFFTVNRFQSAPTYDTDLTILDYPLGDFKRIHFGVCPYFSHTYLRKYLFFSEKSVFSSQYFEFIGERKQL